MMMMMTSAVDLRKVHVALSWLGEHNHFYKDVPSYSLSDIEKNVRDDNNKAPMLVENFQPTHLLTTSLTSYKVRMLTYLTQT